MPEFSNSHRGTIIASTLLAAGATGTIVDPNGPVGITLFGVAAVAALYLIARPFRNAVRRFAATPRSKPTLPRPVAGVVRRRTVVTVVAAMGVLFTVWLATDMARPLVYACWWGFTLLAAWLTAVVALTAYRSLATTR